MHQLLPKGTGAMDRNLLTSLPQISKELKRDDRSLRNRVQSILLDNEFLETRVHTAFPDFPLIPNERCGLWYCNPSHFAQTSYFKSTDGHANQWDFSTRRLNFHLLPTLQEAGGVVIVDSTRRGKKIPDALSKTVPLWCAVLNSLMLESVGKKFNVNDVLFVPPETVPESERDQMAKKLPDLVEKLKILNVFDGTKTSRMLDGKLLRPFWVFPGSSLLQSCTDIFTGEQIQNKWEVSRDENIVPIILCTVSYQAQDGIDKRNGFTYVQGAADDHELWSHGLEANIFWSNIDKFKNLSGGDSELYEIVDKMVTQQNNNMQRSAQAGSLDKIMTGIDKVTSLLSLGEIHDNVTLSSEAIADLEKCYSTVIVLSETVHLDKDASQDNEMVKIFRLTSGSKKSSKNLRAMLPDISKTINNAIILQPIKPLLICCNTGKDMSIGVLLAVLCQNYDEVWDLLPEDVKPSVSKIVIRRHLTKLIAHLNGRNVNPSRATLNSINSFLM
ncbi:tRNA A64-2'-O-ribosylphosphate transferase KNAG_0J00220 [Huiozyma naganishii CBS 8797]|uniref:Initiator tRNA phosphoribosyl transferase n=1 Tax=Huiozyma naganishii (strain ATCC MYA-139 / BCRC 22969 / CBS 8797 / KCTC 17520 / NBRC 10181 / NCYC 3082 / Yp74L-3) TaxID=1071383 RepID=J7RB50_HUIN7|nr:hypothetical protein KNAG_0J00220 [Kazachstania naganishii CBS 8797]CCK72105.1 hypothetical protein KNAG_0J00220 [Kazachstania naganishii CBS 8797]